MKNSKSIIFLSIFLALSMIGNFLFYFKPTFLVELSHKVIKEKPVFEISNIIMKMTKESDFGVVNGGVVRADFDVKNISNSTQILYAENIALFDFKDNNYLANEKFHLIGNGDNFTQLSVAEKITPGITMKMSLMFEVPSGEFYCLGYSDNIKIIDKQIFIDDIRNVICKFNNYDGMLEARKKYLNGEARKTGRAGDHPKEDYVEEVSDSANE